MKVPGSEQLEKCWGMSHQRQSRVQNNHTHHGCQKNTKAGRNKRISQKLRCPSCGDMPWTRWIGPKPRNERAQDARCPKATWNRVGGTTKTTKTFLKLTLKLCPVNNNFKKNFSTPLKFTLACNHQRALGSRNCSKVMLLQTTTLKL